MTHDAARNPYIHGLRGVLAFALFLFHVANSNLPTAVGGVWTALNAFLFAMEHGVELFFGISGIVIVAAFRKSASLSAFAVNRATRIFPVLWATTLVILFLSVFDGRHAIPTGAVDIAANLLALPGVFPLPPIHPAAWTISYEFAFYGMFVLFSLCAAVMSRRAAFAAVLLLAAPLVWLHPRAACFVVGVGLALMPARTVLPGARFSGLLLIAAMLAWRGAFTLAREVHQMPNDLSFTAFLLMPSALGLFAFGLLCAVFGLAGVCRGEGTFARFLRLPAVQWLGTVSFSLYLWQTIVMAIVKRGMYLLHLPDMLGAWSQMAFFCLALPPTLVVSFYSQMFLEARFTQWLRRRALSPVAVTAR